MKIRYIALCVGLLVGLSCEICAQQHIVQHQYNFKQKTVDDGLSNNRISAIHQDNRGFIWFGSYNGLDRFDGRNIVNYKHDPSKPGTISGNDIRAIFSDSEGTLWVGGNGGLDYFDLPKEQFITFDHDSLSGGIGRVDAIKEDQSSNLWIASTKGLFRYNLKSKEFYQFPQNDDSGSLPEGQVSRILVDRNNNLWIAIYKKYLCYYNQKSGEILTFKNEPRNSRSLSGNQIERMYEDRSGNVWFGTMNNGLNRYNPATRDFTRIIPDANDDYSTRVRAIFEDFEGNFFVGTRGGVYMRNRNNDKFFMYASSEHPFSTLSQNSIQCSYIDSTGTLWIGTFAGGVNFTNLQRKPFIHYSSKTDNSYFLSSPNVYAFCEDDQNNLWVGTDNGLNRLDRNSGRFRAYFNNPNDRASLSYNDVKSLSSDREGNIWVGTNQGGLNFYNRRTGRFSTYMHDDDDPGSISTDKIYGLLLDRNSDLWVLNGVGYLDILRNGSSVFEHIAIKPYYGIIEGSNDKLWIGGQEAIYAYDYNSEEFTEIKEDSLLGDVYTLMEASNGELWIGGETGIVIYDVKNQSFEALNVENAPLNEVYGIKEDQNHQIWISTEEGLIKLSNALTSDRTNIKFRVYTKHDGLQSKQFNYNAHYQSANGELMFGGINGFNIFDPSEIKNNDIPPYVALTDLKVFNRSVQIGESKNGNTILNESISTAKELAFNRHQKSFTIDFVGLHYAQPDANQYRYMLEGYDEDWTYTNAARNFAPYSNLPGGEYTFRVNAANVDGVWAAEDRTVVIEVIPPFWNTWTFRLLVLALLVGGVVAYMRWRTAQARENQQRLERKVAEATDKVKHQNDALREQSDLLQNAIKETNEVVKEAVESGNFSARIDLSNKKGEWKSLGESINHLFESVAKPFTAINEVVNKLADGDLTGRYHGTVRGDIQKLTDNLNKAIVNLSNLLSEIAERARYLKESSSEMLNSGEQMKLSTGEIASAIGEMSNGAHEQVRKIDESSSLIEGVLASSTNMGQQADAIQETAKQGAEKSRSGMDLAQDMDKTMKHILASSKRTNEAVSSLTNRSKEISSVLRIIKEIASQTNLLALNAAIEAAQAGESGRGFAVVAEEIRKLAESSKKSTAEIEELISAVQNDTSETATLIGDMSSSIKLGEQTTSQSLTTFQEIYKYYQETLDKSESIALATKKQTEDISNVVNIISGVVVISEETAAGTEQTASSSAELSAGMQNYQDKSEQVSSIADELQEKVSRFRL